MSQIHTITIGRYDLTKLFAIVAALAFITMVGCEKVPINTNDNSPPQVTIKVNGPNGYQEQTSVNYMCNTSQQAIQIMCIVEDPQGVKSIDMRVSDKTVDVAYCGGAVYSGNYVVDNLPSPVQDILSGSSGKVPTKLVGIIEIPGYYPFPQLATKPPGVTEVCWPANNTQITIRCRGGNWSSNTGSSTTTKYLQVKFKL